MTDPIDECLNRLRDRKALPFPCSSKSCVDPSVLGHCSLSCLDRLEERLTIKVTDAPNTGAGRSGKMILDKAFLFQWQDHADSIARSLTSWLNVSLGHAERDHRELTSDVSSTSLDRYRQNVPWTKRAISEEVSISQVKKKRRAFHTLLSGFTRGKHHGDRLRFMTLTTAVGGDRKRLSRDLQVLRKTIERKLHFKMEYWKINTNEGNGVMHIVFKGRFIPHWWLRWHWLSIHGAPIVDVRVLKNKPKRLANYLVSHYLSQQSFERSSWSWGWVFRGFRGVWTERFANWYRTDKEACLRAWNKLICSFPSYVPGYQSVLGG